MTRIARHRRLADGILAEPTQTTRQRRCGVGLCGLVKTLTCPASQPPQTTRSPTRGGGKHRNRNHGLLAEKSGDHCLAERSSRIQDTAEPIEVAA